jgi:hypothetical protein
MLQQASGERGASCDVASPVSCLHRCCTGELHAPSPTSMPESSSTMTSLHSSKHQRDITLKAYVSSVLDVSSGYCMCLNLDVAIVDRDVAHAAMTIHVCCKCMFQMFQLFSYACCKCIFQMFSCFRHMSQVFYLDIAYVAVAIHICCKRMFYMLFSDVCCNKCFSCCKCFH